jgi:hypothetical protein
VPLGVYSIGPALKGKYLLLVDKIIKWFRSESTAIG